MYSEMFQLQAGVFKALAHERRLEIIQLLRDRELCVSDIYEMLDLPQANISQHLMILREAGIVASRREGKQIVYAVAHPSISDASDLIRDVLIDQHQNSEMASSLSLRMKDLVPLAHDPVCQMRVSPKTASFHTTHAGQDFYFCASGCLKVFKNNPDTFSKGTYEGNHEHK